MTLKGFWDATWRIVLGKLELIHRQSVQHPFKIPRAGSPTQERGANAVVQHRERLEGTDSLLTARISQTAGGPGSLGKKHFALAPPFWRKVSDAYSDLPIACCTSMHSLTFVTGAPLLNQDFRSRPFLSPPLLGLVFRAPRASDRWVDSRSSKVHQFCKAASTYGGATMAEAAAQAMQCNARGTVRRRNQRLNV